MLLDYTTVWRIGDVGITNLLIAKSGYVISAQWAIIFERYTKRPLVDYSRIEHLNAIRSIDSTEFPNTGPHTGSLHYQFYTALYDSFDYLK